MKKKVAILTLYASSSGNYGQILQGYSTFSFLRLNGFDPVILNYIDSVYAPECRYVKRIKSLRFRKAFYVIRNKILGIKYKRVALFEEFITRNIKMTNPCFSIYDAINELKDYHEFVVGSDTCWYGGAQELFTLKFALDEDTKVSFAASSLHPSFDLFYWRSMCEALSRFDRISVREEKLKKAISSILGREIISVLDPVFLLDRSVWSGFCKKEVAWGNFILIYLMGSSSCHEEKIREICALYPRSRVILLRKMENRNVELSGAEVVDDSTVEQFVGLIKNADCIITDSYHGVAFAIILRKQFYVLIRDRNRQLYGRVKNLLCLFGLESRMAEYRVSESRIDYEGIDQLYDDMVEKSKQFLLEALNKSRDE